MPGTVVDAVDNGQGVSPTAADRGAPTIATTARSQQRFSLIENRVADLRGDPFLESAAAEAEGGMPKLSLEVIDGSFSAIRDPEEKRYFMNLPTSFVLPPDDIDRLRDVAARLMRQSPEYESAVRDMGGTRTK